MTDEATQGQAVLGMVHPEESVVPGTGRHPYYIHAPHYVQSSAGTRALHLLCHWLNRKGQLAFIVPFQQAGEPVHPDLLTPLLTPGAAAAHVEQKRVPIAVYPEIISGNPLGTNCVVRYVLNIPGHLGGQKTYPVEDMVWTYSRHLATFCDHWDGVLHMPVIDQNVFHPDPDRPRHGSAYYASKFKNDHNQKVFGLPEGAIEITRGLPDSQTPEEIARLLQGAETFYCFENTALATEAVLCGCPAVFMPNPFLDRPIAIEELGWDGYAWGAEPSEVARARASVPQGQENFRKTVGTFFAQLDAFIDMTQDRAGRTPPAAAVPELLTDGLIFNARDIAARIRSRKRWRFKEWFRIVRALNVVAVRAIAARFGGHG